MQNKIMSKDPLESPASLSRSPKCWVDQRNGDSEFLLLTMRPWRKRVTSRYKKLKTLEPVMATDKYTMYVVSVPLLGQK